ncbi:MAG: aspartate/glutamate racemase family protein [Cyanobacteria bacterium P01_F01_bin.150]
MKTIGLIGGMSWESSLEYYRIINECTKATLGGLNSAKCILYSVNFAEIEALQDQGRWAEAATVLCNAAKNLEQAGADFIVLCTNTMHKVADAIASQIKIPLLHIADATAARVQANQIKNIGLLGTRFTMEQEFYRGRLTNSHGLNVLIPTESERQIIHTVIYEELCCGLLNPESKKQYIEIINRLVDSGAEGIILGCTEIEALVQPADCSVVTFPTARIHAEAAVDLALST